MTNKKTDKQEKGKKLVGTPTENVICIDKSCPTHGSLKVRGRTFEGTVVKKFPKRIAIAFERMSYVKKYERYAKFRTKIHARVPTCMENEINVGDLIKVQECRPLSKIIHAVVVKKVKSAKELKKRTEVFVK